jgi:hypothetical protein
MITIENYDSIHTTKYVRFRKWDSKIHSSESDASVISVQEGPDVPQRRRAPRHRTPAALRAPIP